MTRGRRKLLLVEVRKKTHGNLVRPRSWSRDLIEWTNLEKENTVEVTTLMGLMWAWTWWFICLCQFYAPVPAVSGNLVELYWTESYSLHQAAQMVSSVLFLVHVWQPSVLWIMGQRPLTHTPSGLPSCSFRGIIVYRSASVVKKGGFLCNTLQV